MIVAVTGTPGTGKTTATEQVESDLSVVHLNEVIRDRDLTAGQDTARDTLVADLEAVRDWFDGREDVLVESHLAHHLDADRVVVLRCHPEVLEGRLRGRGEDEETVTENAESEAIDGILAEAVDRHGTDRVYEIDATERTPSDVATQIEAVIGGERAPAVGTVTFHEYL